MLALLAVPLVAAAQAITSLKGLIGVIVDLINRAVPVIIALALLYFFWGIAIFIFNLNTDDEKKRSEGKQVMLWGIIALFVMVSLWGIVKILQRTFFFEAF